MSVMSCPSRVPLPWKDTSIRVCPAEGVITLDPVILPDTSPIWSPNAMGVVSSFPTRFLIRAIPVYHKHVATSRGPARTSQNTSSETVWKFGMGPESGLRKWPRGVERSPDRLPLGAKEGRSRRLQLFSKQFLHATRRIETEADPIGGR